jgi:cell division protein ZapD
MSNKIVYEQPLNERIRIFLRLEHYFNQSAYFREANSAWDTQAGIMALIEILSILDRNDVRSEVLKELDRQIVGLSRIQCTPEVDRLCLESTLQNLANQVQIMHKAPGKLGFEIRDNDLLNSIRQRTAISAGTCGFDLPGFHYLLNQPFDLRAEFLTRWFQEFKPLKEGIDLLLSILRSSTLFEAHVSESGFYQRSLDPQNPCQLVRISMPIDCMVYPEISGSKHRVNVRFLGFSEGRPKQISDAQAFEISCCTI